MWKFGSKSEEQIATLHPDLQRVLREVIKLMDISVVQGYRSPEEQDRAFREGNSELRAGESKHNKLPSLAVDIHPYPYDPEDRERFTYMAGMVVGVAHAMGIRVRWGGDWDQDGEVRDNDFDDLFHFELRDE